MFLRKNVGVLIRSLSLPYKTEKTKWFQVCGLDIRPCVGSSKGWEPDAVSPSPQSPRVPDLWKDLLGGTKTQQKELMVGRLTHLVQ